MNGGGQERGIQSGTVPTPLVVGMGAACELAKKEMEYDDKRISALQERLLNGIRAKLNKVVVNGSMERHYTGNLNLSFAYVKGESLLMGLRGVAVSSGSACTSASLEPSYVLRASGVDEDMAHTSIRFGIGRFTAEANRQAYRTLLVTAPGLGQYISGAILFEETLYQSTADGKKMVDVLVKQNIVPRIKVDKGLVPLVGGVMR